jgi:AraC-like DNA-binding protein
LLSSYVQQPHRWIRASRLAAAWILTCYRFGVDLNQVLRIGREYVPQEKSRRDQVSIDRSAVIARFVEFIEANGHRRLSLREVCAATRTTERMLRACCRERLGMTPNKYLRLHRLELVRLALRTAESSTTTVTHIAAQFGFSELGRFAIEYRELFGELPSASLRRAV